MMRTIAQQRVFPEQLQSIIGAPEGIRTPDLCLRRAALYPAELRARRGFMYRRLREAAIARCLKGKGAGRSFGPGHAPPGGSAYLLGWDRDNHVEFNSRPGRGQLVDADHGARRQPVSEITAHGAVHPVTITNVRKIFCDFHDVAPSRTDFVEDRFDCLHRVACLLLDRVRMDVLFIAMRVMMI